jgi:L-ascorbate metabolism protein UlaG (beta-lactamase superfamily)
MGPREAAYACKLLKPKVVIPMHHGTFPLLSGKPQEFKELIKDKDLEVVVLKPGETYTVAGGKL